jgi:SOS-response transcriptional repressor LexA
MTIPSKKRPLSEEERRECAALNALYKSKKKALNLSQEKIAIEGLQASNQSAASHYLTGRNALNVEAAAVFARYLQVPVSAFSNRLAQQIARLAEAEHSSPDQLQVVDTLFRYPIIEWDVAGNLMPGDDLPPLDPANRYESSEYKANGLAFWLAVGGDSMSAASGQSIADGSLILVDTGIPAFPGKLVIAKHAGSHQATFKKLVEDGGQRLLRPLNLAYPIELLAEDCRIIGVVVRAVMKL